MHAVIAGGDGEAAAGDGDIAIGVDGVIAAIELEGAAGNGDLRPGLETLGADVIGDALTRAAHGGHGGGAPLMVRVVSAWMPSSPAVSLSAEPVMTR